MDTERRTEFYSARKARSDYQAKRSEKNMFVDFGKMEGILASVRKKIQDIDTTDSKSSTFPYPEIQSGYLSPGEIAFLKKLGYKVEYVDGGMHGDFWKISW